MKACLSRRSKTGMGEDNWVLREVQLGLGVSDGGGQYIEGAGGVSRKQSNGGTGFNKTLTFTTEPRIGAAPD